MFIDDEFNDTDGQNAAKQKSDGQADDKETATDEKTKEKSDDQVITGNKTDSKENATDNETEDDDAGEQGNITVTREHDERQHTSNEGDEEHGDDKEMATDEETKEKNDDQVITGSKTDSKENATDNKTEDHDGVEHDAGEQGTLQSPGNMMNISTQAMKVTKSMCNGLEQQVCIMTKVGPRADMTKNLSVTCVAKNSTINLE